MRADPGHRRHDLVTLAPSWEDGLAAPLAPVLLARVRAWVSRGLPLVAARSDPARPGAVALGLSLPPGEHPRRIAVLVAPIVVREIAPPLALAAALASGPAAWRGPLLALDREALGAGLRLGVYGSLAWQHLSGERYLTDASDVDLLIPARDAGELRSALALLRRRATLGAPRLDGEVLLPGGAGVAWRELLSGAERVLVKSLAAVALEPSARALARLGEAAP